MATMGPTLADQGVLQELVQEVCSVMSNSQRLEVTLTVLQDTQSGTPSGVPNKTWDGDTYTIRSST